MDDHPEQIAVGVIGCGHWGPNHVRVFAELEQSCVVACADMSETRLHNIRRRFPQIRTTTDYRNLLEDPFIEAVVIATPTATHAELTRAALLAGKHVLVEKPLCVNSQEGRELAALADSTGLVLIVGHIFLHNNGIKKLRELTVDGKLGKIQYLDAVRTNLGPIRGDVNALFDLGTHDISIFNYLVGAPPVEVSATGRRISQSTQEDVCFATLRYADGTLGHIHVSWLNPRKVRTLTVVGEKKMAHWDDVDPVDALRLYDIRIEEPPQYDSFGEFQYRLRTADIHLPKIQRVEPLVNQANAFLDAIRGDTTCRASAAEGVAVVAVLEAAAQSMREGGQSCLVDNSMILEPAGRNS